MLCFENSVIVVIVESVAMSENGGNIPQQVLNVPKERPRGYGLQVEEAGQTIVAKIQKAAELSIENCDRAFGSSRPCQTRPPPAARRLTQGLRATDI